MSTFTPEHRKQLETLEALRQESLRDALRPYLKAFAGTKSEEKVLALLQVHGLHIQKVFEAHK